MGGSSTDFIVGSGHFLGRSWGNYLVAGAAEVLKEAFQFVLDEDVDEVAAFLPDDNGYGEENKEGEAEGGLEG